MITDSGGSKTTATDNRRRTEGIVRTRGGMRIPAVCMVAIRKFKAGVSTALRTIIPEACIFLATNDLPAIRMPAVFAELMGAPVSGAARRLKCEFTRPVPTTGHKPIAAAGTAALRKLKKRPGFFAFF